MARLAISLALAAAVLVAAVSAPARRTLVHADCSRTSTSFVPLTDLRDTYQGYGGGLYDHRHNTPKTTYAKEGLAAAKRVKPIDGKIVLLSIGMSNTTQEFSAFVQLASRDPRKSLSVLLVDGAQGGQDAERIKDPSAPFWSVVGQRLAAQGASDAQVQAVWLKEAIAGGGGAFPLGAQRLRDDLRAIVGILAARFPNLRVIYVSSRTYAGYATTPLNPEPYAYESGFAVKWLILDRMTHKLGGPWIGWGPYLWTNGTQGRSDGFVWNCGDAAADGTHPSDSGRQKVAELLMKFFTTDVTARSWFVGERR